METDMVQEKMATDIICLVDKSASMALVKKEAIEGFNNFIRQCRELNPDCHVTLIFFNETWEPYCRQVKISKVRRLKKDRYIPSGQTALYDAICESIDLAAEFIYCEKSKLWQPIKALLNGKGAAEPVVKMAILSDGEDNCSEKYNVKDVLNKLSQMSRDYSWEFLFLCADRNIFENEDELLSTNTVVFKSNANGIMDAFNTMTTFIKRGTQEGGWRPPPKIDE